MVPCHHWFEYLEALEGRTFAWGIYGGRHLDTGMIEVADWAPFDRIVELVIREDGSLRRRRLLIDLPYHVDTAVLSTGRTRVRVLGAGARATLVMPTTHVGVGAVPMDDLPVIHRRLERPILERSTS